MITKTEVEQNNRLNFLPMFFGKAYPIGESTVYNFLSAMTNNYNGGFWQFFTLSNGGYFMAPKTDEVLSFSWPDNYFEGELSAEAGGIVACLMALSHLSFKYQSQLLSDHFEKLREFALAHAEATLIFRAID